MCVSVWSVCCVCLLYSMCVFAICQVSMLAVCSVCLLCVVYVVCVFRVCCAVCVLYIMCVFVVCALCLLCVCYVWVLYVMIPLVFTRNHLCGLHPIKINAVNARKKIFVFISHSNLKQSIKYELFSNQIISRPYQVDV